MITIINIQAFLLLFCGLIYLAAALVIDRDIRRLRNTNYNSHELLSCMESSSRNRRYAIKMFITAIIMDVIYLSAVMGSCQYSDDFLLFTISANTSVVLLVCIDLIENVTNLHRYIHYRLPILLSRLTIVSWILSLVLFFLWLPSLAVITVAIACLCGFYIIWLEYKHEKDLES